MYVAAHEWIGAFTEAGYAMNLEDHIAANPEFYGDIIDVLWDSVRYKGARYGVPQDSEVRMFFYNKDMLRQAGKSEELIEGLPAAVESGDFTIYDLVDLAKEVMASGAAKYGMVHRPNVGPDFQMTMESFGIDPYDDEQAKLQMSRSRLASFYKWLKYAVDQGVLPDNMTAWSWDSVHARVPGRRELPQVPRHLERRPPDEGVRARERAGVLPQDRLDPLSGGEQGRPSRQPFRTRSSTWSIPTRRTPSWPRIWWRSRVSRSRTRIMP